MKIIGIKKDGHEVLVATGKKAEEIAAGIGIKGDISKKMFSGMTLIWEDDNGRRSQHLEEA